MIDTVKIYTMIDKNVYDNIYYGSDIYASYNLSSGELFYEVVNGHLSGSYDNRLSVRAGPGIKYHVVDKYYLEIEGSYHKIIKGQNAFDGFYSLVDIVKFFISAVEYSYNIKLPNLKHWFLQRVDVAICFDLLNNKNVCNYINNLRLCSYPRRNIKHYQDESIYCTGTTSTLKVYNKLLEFRKHDIKKFYNTSFNLINFMNKIDGFVRFECEIKKKKLEKMYNKKYIRVINVRYDELRKVWSDEFMKLLKMFENDLYVVHKKEEIKDRLFNLYTQRQASILYNFYICLMCDGKDEVMTRYSSTTFYRNLNYLKHAGIDLSQKYSLTLEDNHVEFNPFEMQEVL